MNRQRHKMYTIVFYILMTRLAVNDTNTFINTLMSAIEEYEDSIPSETSQQFAMYRIPGCTMDIGDFCRRVKYLYPKHEDHEMRYIITIRCTNANNGYNAFEFTRKISAIIQKYFGRGEKYILEDNLLITVDEFEVTIDPYDSAGNANPQYMNEIQQKFIEMVIDYHCSEPFKMLLDIFITHINRCLRNLEGLAYLKKIRDSGKMQGFCTDEYGNIIRRLCDMLSGKNTDDERRNFDEVKPKNFAALRLLHKIRVYNKKIGYKNPEMYAEPFIESFKHLKSGFKKLFTDRTNDVIRKFLVIFKLKENKDLFIKNFEELINKFINYTQNKPEHGIKCIFMDCADSFCESEADDLILNQYLQDIYSHDIKCRYRELYETNNFFPGNLSYIKIVCDKSINKNDNKVKQICKILQDTNVFEHFYINHHIYIETENVFMENAKNLCKFMKCDVHLKVINDADIIKIYLLIKPDNERSRLNNTQLIRYKRHVTKSYDKSCLSYINVIKRFKETFVGIYKSDEPAEEKSKEGICSSLRDILDANYGKVIYSHTMPHVNYPGSLFLYIVRPEVITLDSQILSLVRDTALVDILNRFSDVVQNEINHNNLFKIPTAFIEKVACYINCLNFVNSANSNERKYHSANHTDFVYVENTLELEGPYGRKSYMCDFFGKLNIDQNKTLLPIHISIDQIDKFENFESYSSAYIRNVLWNIGIKEALLNQLLRKFISNKYTRDWLEKRVNTPTGYGKMNGLDILVMIKVDGTFELYVFEVIDSKCIPYIVRDVTEIRTNLAQSIDMLKTAHALDHITIRLGHKPVFTQYILEWILKQMRDILPTKNLYDLRMMEAEFPNIILTRIRIYDKALTAENYAPEDHDKKPKRLHLLAFIISVDPIEVKKIAEILIDELKRIVEIKKVKLTILRIKEPVQTQEIVAEDHSDAKTLAVYPEKRRRRDCVIA